MDINILDLHFDILIHICEQIETIDDKINFAKAHQELFDVFAYCNRKEDHSKLDFFHRKYVRHCDFYLAWWGSSLTSIDNSRNHVDSGYLMEIAAKFCPNLERVMLAVEEGNIKKLKNNFPKLKMLKDIQIVKYQEPRKYAISGLIKSFQSLPNLRSLNFFNSSLNNHESKLT